MMRERNNSIVADSQITKIGSMEKDSNICNFRNSIGSISSPNINNDLDKLKKK